MCALAVHTEYEITRRGVRGTGVQIELSGFAEYMGGRVRDAHVHALESDAMEDDLREAGAAGDFDYCGLSEQMQAGVPVEPWRVGESLAGCYLEDCRNADIYHSSLDLRNPRAVSTGADLAGYSTLDGRTVFLFGEVKTSAVSGKRPPPVMLNMYNQLEKLGQRDAQFRLILWMQLKQKEGGTGAADPSKHRDALESYAQHNRLLLVGVLVASATPDEVDLCHTCDRLAGRHGQGGAPRTDLYALYIPVHIDDLPGYMRRGSS